MLPLLSSDQMRALDQNAIEAIGIPSLVLMENAARSVIEILDERFGEIEDLTIAIVCGPGNNGGDGFAIARLLYLRGCDVDVFTISPSEKFSMDAKTNYLLLENLGASLYEIAENDDLDFSDYDLILDAIFGTGSSRAPTPEFARVIEAINDSNANVLSIDLPSGVDSSTGLVPGHAVYADLSVIFQFAKIGLIFPPGRDYSGDVIVVPASIPGDEDILGITRFHLPDDEDVLELLPPRLRDAHKGDFGNVLVIAGSLGMSGAARLASLSALRGGAGLVRAATPESVRSEVAGSAPEVMTIGLPETKSGHISATAMSALKEWLNWCDVIALGPGFGTESESAEFIKELLKIGKQFVIDADALNLIASHDLLNSVPRNSVLTPHPGEFARLSGKKINSFFEQAELASAFAREHHIVLHLKGSPALTFNVDGSAVVNPTGNPGLATAGTGDVLTGLISALCAQGLPPFSAAWVGAFLHGRSADLLVHEGDERALIAGDVIEAIPDAFMSLHTDSNQADPSGEDE